MCIIDCLSTIVFILPLHLDYTKVIILILWWRNFQLEYWRTFQLVSTRYPDGSRFVYDFKADNPIKVTIQTGMWSNNSFSLYTHGDFRIGFSATGLSSGQQTREFSYGDRVTIYADGADYAVPGEGDRWRYNYLRGFFTTRWQALDDLGEYSQTSAGSYSFTATKDITINIVFMPTIR